MLEKAGIPSVPVTTAREMAELWGVPDFRFVMMPHPLASLTPEGVEQRAEALTDGILRLLQQGQPR
jgi:hypothetical protein